MSDNKIRNEIPKEKYCIVYPLKIIVLTINGTFFAKKNQSFNIAVTK